MHEQFLRTEMVLGQPALECLQSAHVAVFGLGGVAAMPPRSWPAPA